MRKSRFTVALVIAFVFAVVVIPDSGDASTLYQGTTSYVVRSGDNLSSIASRFGSSVSAIVQANGLASTVIRPGQSLVIPLVSGSIASSPGYSSSSSNSTYSGGTHIVRSGESLWSIANRYGVSTNTLRVLNGLSGDVILPGQMLLIPASSNGTAASSALPSGTSQNSSGGSTCGGSYTVQPGDTLSSIAARCGTTVYGLRVSNGISGSAIFRGQTLQVPSGYSPAAPRTVVPSLSTPGVAPRSTPVPAVSASEPLELPFPTPIPPFPPLSYPAPGS